jgi:hypothetical protein
MVTRMAAEKSEEADVLRRELTKEKYERVRMEEAHRYDLSNLVVASNCKTKISFDTDPPSDSSTESECTTNRSTSSDHSSPRIVLQKSKTHYPVHGNHNLCSKYYLSTIDLIEVIHFLAAPR